MKLQFPHHQERIKYNRILNLTSDVSHRSRLPFTKLPIVMWKYVFPLLQLEILVKGYVASISCINKSILTSRLLSNKIDDNRKTTDKFSQTSKTVSTMYSPKTKREGREEEYVCSTKIA